LDLSLGAANDRRTAELAAILEQIAKERNDRQGVERFAELRLRFQRSAGMAPAQGHPKTSKPAPAAPQEFAVPVIQAELDEPVVEAKPDPVPAQAMAIPMPAESAVHEVDLSDEWAALSQQLESAMQEEPEPAHQEAASSPHSVEAHVPVTVPEEPPQMHAEAAAKVPEFNMELQSMAPVEVPGSDTMEADSLLSDLAGELQSMSASLGLPPEPVRAAAQNSVAPAAPSSVAKAPAPRPASGNGAPAADTGGSLGGPLGDLFEEFRTELGETSKDEEDPETHYNLGIAYREMGLLEEAISEFQKVASSTDKGPAFRYAMQCSTLLGLAFMEKGQPAIAAIWYERALKTPGLDQESILALRYDLGVAQELAGETQAAYKSFTQVYAMNIDYRDVSERIALLGKAR
jgi:TolA-binding protein